MTKELIYMAFLEKLKQKLIAKYDQLGLRASGKYEADLEPKVDGDKLIMLSAKHAGAMEHGIRPSHHRYGAVGAIRRWIEVKKGLPSIFYEKKKSMSFAIAKKIANEGIKVPNEFNKGEVVSSVIQDVLQNDVQFLLDRIGQNYITRLQSDVVDILTKLN